MNAPAFYILASAAALSTLMAITRREMIHAVVYLVMSFFALALIFYMMGAPLIAALEVIVYAGAIMVLFLFIVMMLDAGGRGRTPGPFIKTWGPALLIGAVILVCLGALMTAGTGMTAAGAAYISPRTFGQALYTRHMPAVEAVSLLLLFALVGALYLGKHD